MSVTREEMLRLLENTQPSWRTGNQDFLRADLPFGKQITNSDWSNSGQNWTKDGYDVRGPQLERTLEELPVTRMDFDVYPKPKEEEDEIVMAVCPAVTLVCDSIMAVAEGCFGFPGYIDDTTHFLTETSVHEATCGTPDVVCTFTRVTTVDPLDCSTSEMTSDSPVGCHTEFNECFLFCLFGGPPVIDSNTTGHCGDLSEFSEGQRHWTLSDEFTPSDTCDLAIDNLPSYPGTFDGDCLAILDSPDEEHTSCTIQRFKYKFTFSERSGYLKIWWTERFTPEGGGGFTDTAMDWTWNPADHIGETVAESDTYEVLEPDSDGEIGIVNIRWSTSEDCTPEISMGDMCDPESADCTGHYNNCCLIEV